jgi:hypothetical protein
MPKPLVDKVIKLTKDEIVNAGLPIGWVAMNIDDTAFAHVIQDVFIEKNGLVK